MLSFERSPRRPDGCDSCMYIVWRQQKQQQCLFAINLTAYYFFGPRKKKKRNTKHIFAVLRRFVRDHCPVNTPWSVIKRPRKYIIRFYRHEIIPINVLKWLLNTEFTAVTPLYALGNFTSATILCSRTDFQREGGPSEKNQSNKCASKWSRVNWGLVKLVRDLLSSVVIWVSLTQSVSFIKHIDFLISHNYYHRLLKRCYLLPLPSRYNSIYYTNVVQTNSQNTAYTSVSTPRDIPTLILVVGNSLGGFTLL